MTKLIHSLPWTLALSLAAQAGESEAIRIPFTGSGSAQESFLDPAALDSESSEYALQNAGFDPALYTRLKKSLEM